MNIIKCLIVDDEPLAQRVVEKYIADLPMLEVVGKCKNALEALAFIQQEKVDLLFLDINMPKLSGLDFLKTARNVPLVIITSAYREYALESYEFDVVDYLKKPFPFDRFLKAVQKAQDRLSESSVTILQPQNRQVVSEANSDNFIFVKSNKISYRLDFDSIYYVEAYGDYIKIVTSDKTITTYQSMKGISKLLPVENFVRIHKSFIVAVSKIESVEGNLVQIFGQKIPVGSNYRSEFQSLIDKYS